jgi:hypothetical protein
MNVFDEGGTCLDHHFTRKATDFIDGLFFNQMHIKVPRVKRIEFQNFKTFTLKLELVADKCSFSMLLDIGYFRDTLQISDESILQKVQYLLIRLYIKVKPLQ